MLVEPPPSYHSVTTTVRAHCAKPRCGHYVIDHFLCEVPALLKLSCVDVTANEAELFFVSVFFHLTPLSLILTSYAFIARAILKIQSAEGRQKAFGTCSSHLIVVSLFYGTALSVYLLPPSPHSKAFQKVILPFPLGMKH